jgi:hypothetical protein
MDLTYKHIDFVTTLATYERARPSAFERNLEDTIHICKGRGIDLILCTFAADDSYTGRDVAKNDEAIMVRGVDDLNVVVSALAQKHSVPLVDLARLMPRNPPGAADKCELYFSDVCHLGTRGNRAKANLLGEAIAERLEARFGTKRQPFAFDTAPAPKGYPDAQLKRLDASRQ